MHLNKRYLDYQRYIRSAAWRQSPARLEALRRDGYCCRGCNTAEALEVHHRTYVRLYQEDVNDLTTLCTGCHRAITDRMRRVRHQAKPLLLRDTIHIFPTAPKGKIVHVESPELHDTRPEPIDYAQRAICGPFEQLYQSLEDYQQQEEQNRRRL